MGFIDFLMKLFSGLKFSGSRRLPPAEPTITAPVENVERELPDRLGTFIISDIYWKDLGPNPPFEKLVGADVSGKEVVGCVIKASQGLGLGKDSEDWFRRNWKRMKDVGGERYGADWFRGAYHFLMISVDGAKQADHFCDLIDSAGGWGPGDLMPWVDVEEGGQGKWADGEKLEAITDAKKRARLAAEVTKCVTAFVKRFKERTGLRIAVYGRGIFRDLRMTNCRFGEDSYVNPAYTRIMPMMDKYGVPLNHISLWQLCGDGEVYCPGFEGEIKGWGKEDYSVYIDGNNKTTLKSLRDRCLAKKP